MKNNFISIFLTLILSINLNNYVKSEEFIFKSDTIELKNNGNTVEARGGVKIQGTNNIEITAKNSFYNRLDSKLLLKEKVVFYDKKKNLKIISEEIIYNKSIEKIISIGKTQIQLADKYTIITENIEYFKKENIIQSKSKATLLDKFNNQISTTDFKYLTNKKLFYGNNINMLDADQNNYFFEKSMIDLKNDMLLAKNIEINFAKNIFGNPNNDPRLKGTSLYANNDKTMIKNGIFTSCKKNDTCPPWSLKSSKITHDKEKKTISYKNAWLQIYDKPILYFPKFFHPDPSVKRQSGFLMPGILNSSTSGNSIKLPYFNAISENKDFTLTPRFYFNGDVMVQNEFRQIEKNYENILDFSLKSTKEKNKSHFFSNSKIDLNLSNFDVSNLEINLETASHDTYLKTEKIVTQGDFSSASMNNYLNFNAFNEDLDIMVEFRAYEDLSIANSNDKFEYVYPNFKINKALKTTPDSAGSFNYQVSGFQRKYETNRTEQLLINDFNFLSKHFFSKLGFKNDYSLSFKNSNKDGENSSTYKNGLTSSFYSLLNLNSSVPLIKKSANYENELIPRVSLFISPNKSENITGLDRKINTTNVFSKNRLGLTESLEGGQSLTLGTEYNIKKNNEINILEIDLAQIYRNTNDKNLPTKSTMNNKTSDLLGDIKFKPNKYLDLEYNFSLDNNFKTLNYNMLKSSLSVNNFITTFEFLEENNEIGSTSYILNETSLALSNSSRILFRERRNKETDLKEFYNIMYQYENDCLVAALEYNKDYYTDRDLKPSEELFFSITIIPLSTFNTPSLSK
jgi:LPS-assembly protein